jgi:tetratricopeptide (TPR) repeat protein
VWDAVTGTELLTIGEYEGPIWSAVFTPDGKTLAVAGPGVTLLESTIPPGGYGPRRTLEAARKVVDELHEKYGYYYEVIDKLQADKALDEPTRKLALQIAKRKAIDELPQKHGLYGLIGGITADILNGQSWRVVRLPDGNEAAYRKALSKAQKAVGLRPDDWTILDTLGGAQYRVGAYEDALETLARSERIRLALYDDPCWDNLAFAAMALHRLGRADEAKATLQQLRALLKDDRFADHEEAKALLAEAEKLLAGGNGQRK